MKHFGSESFQGAKKLAEDFLKDESSGGKLPTKEELEKGARAVLTAGALLSAALAQTAEAQGLRPVQKIERVEKKIFSEHEIDFLAQNVYHEARGESLQGQLAVLQVTLGRLASGKFDRGKGLIDGVIFAPNQYSWTKDPRVLMSQIDTEKLENIRAIVSLFVGGKAAADAVSALREQTGLPKDTHFYKRNDWNRENPKVGKKMSKETEDMFNALTPVGVIDNHTFYIDIRPAAPRRTASLNNNP